MSNQGILYLQTTTQVVTRADCVDYASILHWQEVLTRPFSIDNISNMTEAIDIKFRTHNPKYIWCRNLWKSCTVTVVYNCTCYGVWFYCFARELGVKNKQMTKICILIFFDNFMTEKNTFGSQFVNTVRVDSAERARAIAILQTAYSRKHECTS